MIRSQQLSRGLLAERQVPAPRGALEHGRRTRRPAPRAVRYSIGDSAAVDSVAIERARKLACMRCTQPLARPGERRANCGCHRQGAATGDLLLQVSATGAGICAHNITSAPMMPRAERVSSEVVREQNPCILLNAMVPRIV